MATAPALDDILIYARSPERRGGSADKTDTFQVGSMVFASRDAAVSAATPMARTRGVTIWLIRAEAAAELVKDFRQVKRAAD